MILRNPKLIGFDALSAYISENCVCQLFLLSLQVDRMASCKAAQCGDTARAVQRLRQLIRYTNVNVT